MEFIEVSAKTVNDAITEACQKLCVPSDRLDYQVVSEGSSGFLGIGSKPAIIKARIKEEIKEEVVVEVKKEKTITKEEKTSKVESFKKENNIKKEEAVKNVKREEAPKKSPNTDGKSNAAVEECAKTFLTDVFKAMKLNVVINVTYNQADRNLDVDLSGDEMGVLIGKRGQTLDSLQYLVSLVVNKDVDDYIRVKVDTENYRQRRKDTLENLAKNIAYKVKRTRRSVSLEPMNPYERRIIHSALQNDKYVTTHSEGEEPFRKVVVTLKR